MLVGFFETDNVQFLSLLFDLQIGDGFYKIKVESLFLQGLLFTEHHCGVLLHFLQVVVLQVVIYDGLVVRLYVYV